MAHIIRFSLTRLAWSHYSSYPFIDRALGFTIGTVCHTHFTYRMYRYV